jgi:hypothetical protein
VFGLEQHGEGRAHAWGVEREERGGKMVGDIGLDVRWLRKRGWDIVKRKIGDVMSRLMRCGGMRAAYLHKL